MKNKAIKGVVFVLLRTFLEAIGAILFVLLLNLEIANIFVIDLVLYFFISIIFAVIPHFFVRDVSFGFITLFNFLSQIALAVLLFVLLILFIMIDSSDSTGWLGFILISAYVIILPILFVGNLLVDLIVHAVTKKTENK